MLIDYRVYCSLYAILFISYFVSFPLVSYAGGKYFSRFAIAQAVSWAAVLLANYLDWLWS